MKIGFIGLGIMGKPMCKNLLKAGYECSVYNRSDAAAEELKKAGAKKCRSAAEAARDRDVVITMLPDSPQVKEVVLGEDGIAYSMKKGSVLVDMSSIAPPASQQIGAELAKLGVEMLDAPVSGGETGAINKTLSIMVGGSREIYEGMKELLLCMGSSAVYCGKLGAGNTAKLVNQIVVALNIAACSEAFMLAKKSGVDADKVYQAIRGGLAGSAVMETKVPMMLNGDQRPGFKIDLHLKDLRNALETGHNVGMGLPFTAQVTEMLQQLHADGYGNCDHSALIKYYEKMTAMGDCS